MNNNSNKKQQNNNYFGPEFDKVVVSFRLLYDSSNKALIKV